MGEEGGWGWGVAIYFILTGSMESRGLKQDTLIPEEVRQGHKGH